MLSIVALSQLTRVRRSSARARAASRPSIASLMRVQGAQEFHAIQVDRISPDDCGSIRAGGAAATLKGIEFNLFDAFFNRAYRDTDYLCARLHGGEGRSIS